MRKLSQSGWVCFVVAGLSFAACSGPDVEVESRGFVMRQDALAVEQDRMAWLVDVQPYGNVGLTMVFGQGADLEGFVAGAVLVGGPSALLPEGFLVRVEAVAANGDKTFVHTQPATLEDAISEGELQASVGVDPTSIKSFVPLVPGVRLVVGDEKTTVWEPGKLTVEFWDVVLYDLDEDPETTKDQVRVTGSAGMIPRVELDLSIGWTGVRRFAVDGTNELFVDLDFNGQVEFSDSLTVPIAEIEFDPIVIQAGVVPLVLTKKLFVDVGADGTVSASLKMGAHVAAVVAAGIAWEDDDWSGHWDGPTELSDFVFDFRRPEVFPQVAVNAYTSVRSRVRLYGKIGPTAKATATLSLEADKDRYEIRGGLSGQVGFEAESAIVGETLEAHTKPFEFDWVLAEGTF